MTIRNFFTTALLAAALTAPVLNLQSAPAATNLTEESRRKEAEMLAVLRSDKPLGEKAIACKMLAVFGSRDAVPDLAALLTNEQLSSWARIGLEAIPGAEADRALRQALGQVNGRLLVGVINSIGVRRDVGAIGDLIERLHAADDEVAAAAAVALGRIGGERAAQALTRNLAQGTPSRMPGLAEGCIRCAEGFLADKQAAPAARLYETVRLAAVPKQKQLEATRGVILARGDAGIPLLMEQLKSSDLDLLAIGLRTARELPGRKATEALAGGLRAFAPERQPRVLLALADRNDAAALPTIVEAARTGSEELRLVAIHVLERQGDVSVIPTLLETAGDQNTKLAQAAQASLVRLPGERVEADLLNRLQSAQGKTREVLIRVAGQRQMGAAIPFMVSATEAEEAGVRGAAVQAVGLIGGVAQLEPLVQRMQKTTVAAERDDLETALIAISGRTGAASVPALLPLARNGQESVRVAALHALAAAGGPEALKVINATAVAEGDDALRDEAVRTLATWPNTWPEDGAIVEPLLALARGGAKTSHQVLALRGYLQYVQGNRNLGQPKKIAAVREVLPLIKRPDEKRLVISVVDSLADPAVVDLLVEFGGDAAVKEDACAALVKLCGRKNSGLDAAVRRKGLEAAAEKTGNEDLRKRARSQAAEI